MAAYRLELNKRAEIHLDKLYEDGFLEWGEKQADTYYDGLLSHFDRLCDNPRLFRAVDEIREGYRRSVYKKHAIYYRVGDDFIEIVAVLKHQNIDDELP